MTIIAILNKKYNNSKSTIVTLLYIKQNIILLHIYDNRLFTAIL